MVKSTKDNLAIQNAINSFKEELRGYKALKNTILRELLDFKYQKRQMNYLSYKRFCENRKSVEENMVILKKNNKNY